MSNGLLNLRLEVRILRKDPWPRMAATCDLSTGAVQCEPLVSPTHKAQSLFLRLAHPSWGEAAGQEISVYISESGNNLNRFTQDIPEVKQTANARLNELHVSLPNFNYSMLQGK